LIWRTAEITRTINEDRATAPGAGSSKKKEKRRRRGPANGHVRFEPPCPDVSKRSDSDRVMRPLRDHP
jgi:hypothetical protein